MLDKYIEYNVLCHFTWTLPKITKAVLELLRCWALLILAWSAGVLVPSTNEVQSMLTMNGEAIIGLMKPPKP